ncbi:UDP-Glycosyltransferase superfamily protein [Rhynchospora pubera]|uniref:UDP-Glycosyltransferase superfamily protein n=1 Tax=Rhynchospora pubera TaxID=906938 RepID=A0AAV8GBD0_9POAL|nr:UDP-Glycosyltransferase superfamily protein [Rhynchospora pubera]
MPTGVSRRGPHVLPDREPAVRPSDRGASGVRQRREPRKPTWHRNYCVYCVGLSMVVAWVIVLAVFQQGSINVDVRRSAAEMLLHGELKSTERRVHRMLPFSSLSVEERFADGKLEIERSRRANFVGLRPPRLALVIGSANGDAQLLMLLTLTKGLTELGYRFTVFTFEDGGGHYLWQNIGYQVHLVDYQGLMSIDWSNYEGVILASLEGQRVLSSLMQDPFLSIPLIWLIHEDTLGKHLREYEEKGFDGLISQWRSSFRRANAIVFPDFSLPLLYATLGGTNFMVIAGPLADVLKADTYLASHPQHHTRKDYGYGENELIILFVGSYFHYDDTIWDFATTMQALASQVSELEGSTNAGVHSIFLCGNSSDTYSSSFQELAAQMGFPANSIRCYPFDHDVSSLLLIADIVLHASFNEEPSFPPLLLRAMSFGVPIIAPNISQITKNVVDGVNGFLFQPKDPATLAKAFSLVIGQQKLSDLAKRVADEGKLLAKDMLAFEFVSSYAKLLENLLYFPSNVMLPAAVSQIQQKTWSWDWLERKTTNESDQSTELSVIEMLERQFEKNLTGISQLENETLSGDFPTELDWEDLNEIEISEDIETREMQELEERIETPLKTWEEVYHTARKAEKAKPEKHERDEGELERTGEPVCIYEIYDGGGSWSFLHHGSFYRGITLSRSGKRPGTDDVDAVSRLPVLEDSQYRDLLCEFGALLSVANKVDNIHKLPWIGFQSWRATSRMVALSRIAEEKLETMMMEGNKGDTVIYWARMDMDLNEGLSLDFWSMCDSLNAGHCRSLFSDAFRKMYGLGEDMASLPPMPDGESYWSALHCWIMPTPSFLEFIMFSRMFLDSLDQLSYNKSNPSCVLGSSEIEKRHCYCRVMEFLVNIWAYHSGRRMLYLNPVTAQLSEQHPLEQRRGLIWSKYFQRTLLKTMDEDLAEEADDGIYVNSRRLWPLLGEVHWQGVFDREREQRYVKKMDKKRKAKERLLDRQKHGYKQKALG